MIEPTTPSRPRGRPRADGGTPPEDVREAILEAAAALFVDQGYAGTTTRQIAAGVGLRQGSLHYYFPRKEHMLVELLNRTVDAALDVPNAPELEGCPALARLAALVLSDARNLCRGRHNIASLMLLPAARGEAFADFWDQREVLRSRYRELIDDAVDAGQIDVPDTALATDTTFAVVESLITSFDRSGPIPQDQAAAYTARTALRGLAPDGAALDEILDWVSQTLESMETTA